MFLARSRWRLSFSSISTISLAVIMLRDRLSKISIWSQCSFNSLCADTMSIQPAFRYSRITQIRKENPSTSRMRGVLFAVIRSANSCNCFDAFHTFGIPPEQICQTRNRSDGSRIGVLGIGAFDSPFDLISKANHRMPQRNISGNALSMTGLLSFEIWHAMQDSNPQPVQ